MRVIVYVRVSSEEQAERGYSLAAQERLCRERAAQLSDTVVAVVTDAAEHGDDPDRPGLREVRAMLADGRADGIYIIDLDRLHRDYVQHLIIANEIVKAGHHVYSVGDSADYADEERRVLLDVKAAIAADELRRIRRRTRRGIAQRAREGLHHGTPPLGYDFPRGPGGDPLPRSALEVVPEEAALVRRIYDLYLAGASLHEIVRIATDEQWPTCTGRGSQWMRSVVAYILHSQAYLGFVMHDGEAHVAEHEALVTVADWRAVQQRMSRRAGGFGRSGPNSDGTYAALLRCGICGGHVHGVRNSCGHASYRCADRIALSRADRHRPVNAPLTMIDALIDAWTDHLIDGRVLADAARQFAAEEATDNAAEIEAIDRELARVETEMAYHHRAAARGAMPETVADDLTRPLMGQRDQLLSRRQRLTHQPVDTPDWADADMPAIMDYLWSLPPGERAEWLADLYERIDLHGPTITIHHRVPLDPRRVTVPRYVRAEKRDAAARDALGIG